MGGDLVQLRAAVADTALLVPSVSRWSVGMHVHHCCLAMNGICQALADSPLPPPNTRPSLIGTIVLLTGRIARGRGRSPEAVLPRENVSQAELGTLLDESERRLAEAKGLDHDRWFKHFAFGVLTRDNAIRFIDVHNRHHLKIVSDIRSA